MKLEKTNNRNFKFKCFKFRTCCIFIENCYFQISPLTPVVSPFEEAVSCIQRIRNDLSSLTSMLETNEELSAQIDSNCGLSKEFLSNILDKGQTEGETGNEILRLESLFDEILKDKKSRDLLESE